MTNWPSDVLATGSLRTAFLDWRRAQITRLVETVYAQTTALKPAVRVSAAVFPDAVSAYDEVGQDWRRWVTNGIVDFLCPMDYTADLHQFTNRVAQQLAYVGGRIPVYQASVPMCWGQTRSWRKSRPHAPRTPGDSSSLN